MDGEVPQQREEELMKINSMYFLMLLGLTFYFFIKSMSCGFRIEQAFDQWMTSKWNIKRFGKKANKQGFFDLYQVELNQRSHRSITLATCHYAFHAALYRHKQRVLVENMVEFKLN